MGVEHADGTLTAEQDKSNVASNPLSDRSVKFWKTLRNWVEAAERCELDPELTVFVVYTTHPARGPLAKSFSDARTVEDALIALRSARKTLVGNGAKPSKSLQAHLDVVFKANEKMVATIISRFTLDVGKGDPHAEVRSALLTKLVSEEAVEDILRWAHGWVKARVDALQNNREAVRIKKGEFHEALLNHVRAHDRATILHSVAGRPTESQIQDELAYRDYVRQLNVIDADYEDVLEAVNDFLRASVDRTEWADQGWVGEESLDEFARDLKRIWKNCRDRTFIGYSEKPPKQQGTILYRECMSQAARIDHLEVPAHFTRGSWHTLADDLTIGWHPAYLDELKRRAPNAADAEDA